MLHLINSKHFHEGVTYGQKLTMGKWFQVCRTANRVHGGWTVQHKLTRRNMKSSSCVNNRLGVGAKVPSHPFQRQWGRFRLSTASGHLIIEATLFLLVFDDGWMMHHSQMWCKTPVQTCENILREREKKREKIFLAHLFKTSCVMGQTGTNHALNPCSSYTFFHHQYNDKHSQKLNEVEQTRIDRWKETEMAAVVQMVLSVPVFQNVDQIQYSSTNHRQILRPVH